MTNLKNLMLRAWDIRRADGCSMADALRQAWTEIKTAAYDVHMDEKRDVLTAFLATMLIADIHDQHKADIIRAALRADVVDGVARLCGKWTGIIKWAIRKAAIS